MSLLIRTTKGLSWAAAGTLFQAVIGLLTLACLARYIGPAAMGVAGSASAAVGIVDIVVSSALPDALRQRDNLEDRHIDGTFWCCMAISLVAVLLFVAFAEPIARVIGAPGSASILIATALGVPISAAGAIPGSLLARDLRFREDMRGRVICGVVGISVSMTLAILGYGVWALVISELIRRACFLAIASYYMGWVPGVRGGLRAFLELARFNGQTLTLISIGALETSITRLMIARVAGLPALGIYTMARKMLDALTTAVMGPFSSVVMSAAARSQNDREQTGALLLTLYGLSALVVYPAFLGLAALAPVAIPVAFGPQWSAAIVPIQVLMLVGLRSATGSINSSVLRGIGRSDLVLFMLLAGAIGQLLMLPFGAAYGVTGICMVVVARTWLTWPLGALFVRDAIGPKIASQARSGAAAILPALGMCAIVSCARIALAGRLPATALILLLVPLGAASYVGLIALLSPRQIGSARTVLASLRRRDKSGFGHGILGEPSV